MTWIIIGLLIFFIHVYVLKHTVWARARGYNRPEESDFKPLAIPVWVVLLILIAAFVPVLNLLTILPFWIVWVKRYADPESACSCDWHTYWRFRDKLFSRTI
jgi:hypothetical protein